MEYLYTYAPDDMTFYTCGNLVSPDGFIHQRRTLQCHVLIYVLEGTLFLTARGSAYEVTQGQYLFLRGGDEHFGHAASRGRLSYLWLHFNTHTPWLLTASGIPPEADRTYTYFFPEYGADGADFPLLFGELMRWYPKTGETAKAALTLTTRLLLLRLTGAYSDIRESRPLLCSPIVSKIQEYIRTDCHMALTPKTIAAHYGYNCAYLSSLFKKETGSCLTEAIHRERIARARTLLSNPAVSIREAAFSSGFTDEKYFMKLFKRYTGLTPSAYRALTPYG